MYIFSHPTPKSRSCHSYLCYNVPLPPTKISFVMRNDTNIYCMCFIGSPVGDSIGLGSWRDRRDSVEGTVSLILPLLKRNEPPVRTGVLLVLSLYTQRYRWSFCPLHRCTSSEFFEKQQKIKGTSGGCFFIYLKVLTPCLGTTVLLIIPAQVLCILP